eukprot:7391488-Prymnesium_polylepis.3
MKEAGGAGVGARTSHTDGTTQRSPHVGAATIHHGVRKRQVRALVCSISERYKSHTARQCVS